MKKSTILLLVIVYIVSFFVIGLLGQSIKNYNPVIDPESVLVVDPDNKTEASTNIYDEDTGKLLYHYYFVYHNYKKGDSVRIKATVKPDNCSYPDVIIYKDKTDETFSIETKETNSNIEQNFALITLNETLSEAQVASTARILVTTTNPGTQITLVVGVTFVLF